MITKEELATKCNLSKAQIANRARKLGITGTYRNINGAVKVVFMPNEAYAIENCPKEKTGPKKKKSSTGVN